MNALLAALADGAIAVTPNRRLARRLHAEFDLSAASSGQRAWPTPAILPYTGWLTALWETVLAHDAVAEPRTLLSAAQAMALWQRVIEDSGAALADVRGAAALASEAWSLAHAWGAGGESWRSWRQAGDEQDPSQFAAWADTYLARTRRLGVLDIAQAADAIATHAPVIGADSPTILRVGFVELSPQQTRLFTALAGAGATLRDVESLPARDARVSRATASTPRDEITAALCWARAIAIERPGARIGIVVEDLAERRDDVLALAQDILHPASILPAQSRIGAPFDISLGVRLAQVALIGTALDLIALTDAPLTLASAATLLRSPYLPDADALWPRHAALERGWLEQGMRAISLGDTITAFAPYAAELAARWTSGRDALRAARATTPREWVDLWRAWLADAGWPGSRALDSAEFQAREAWEKLLGQFASLGAVAPRLGARAAIAALHAMANETVFQPEGTNAPVQILGVLEGAGLDFDALWIAGLSADRWPAAPRPNPLLPIAWQRERGLPRASAQRELEFARLLTDRFARAADEVVFSSATGLDDPPLSPSALVLAYPQRPQQPAPETWSASMARSAALESLVDERAPPVPPGSPIRGGARAIQTQSDCPFQAVARHRLGAQAWPTAGPGLAAFERGQLAHATLAAFWSAIPDRTSLLALEAGSLDAAIAVAVDKGMTCLRATRWRNVPDAVRAAESRRLNRLLSAWLDIERARPPFSVAAVEARRDLVLGGIGLRMRVDRIDALGDGGIAIIDYKTGVLKQPKPQKWFDERPRASQLGTYTLAQRAAEPLLAVRAVVHAELRTAGVAASGLVADRAAWPALMNVANAGPFFDWRSLESWWEAHLGALATELAGGVATVTPRLKPSPCRICGLQALCRIDSVRFEEPEDDGDA
ncbi:MAG TPA: PD-(D/E)XK nuclease family protein [Casimicrobiaceae bacterium]|nr:PD-(D/E)XK nuclease family protein [Casimicrobiaceae bacterium]